MSEHTAIEWTDHTFNTHWGCSEVSPGCDNCYARRLAARFGYGWGDHAPKREFDEEHWHELLRWDAKAKAAGVRRFVFSNSMSDLFDKFAPAGVRERHFEYIERTPNLIHLLLTKRIGNVRRMVEATGRCGLPDNVWLGISVVNQEEADRDIPKLLAVPAEKHFLSMEPLLGGTDIGIYLSRTNMLGLQLLPGFVDPLPGIDWVIAGGESGPVARPMHSDWVRSLRDQCAAAGVPFLFKQWGEWAPGSGDFGRGAFTNAAVANDGRIVEGGFAARDYPAGASTSDGWSMVHRAGKKAAGRLLDGVEHNGVPSVAAA